ncbi:hypothetical protein BDQ12DRAFT_93119 [Crucibulum laeve]|uniref:SCD domain-containing protein n=1 Tax=Crucibulum laeve TaxID=68775 RepID=A0A5C3LFS3_9AGAR|nr:hypothetical protein BDQ12DRAFT_93119 [Crucibulum laeve]
MSDTPASTPAPRRSQRERKTPKQFTSAVASGSKNKKRKRHDKDTEDDATVASDQEDVPDAQNNEENDGDEEEEEDYHATKPKPTGVMRKGKAKASPKSKGPSPAKKPRTVKPPAPKTVKTATRRGRKPKEGGDAYDADQVAKDTKIAADNPLFNAVMNPAAALQSTAEDFLESLEQSPGAALAELINLVLRSCGCNDSVSADEAVDYDGVLDTLDNFTEALKQENTPVYPLTSKLTIFKKFRKSLSEFIERLITSSADLGVLYTSDLMVTLQPWVTTMSSSQIRSFRHTATVIALEVESALCDVAAAVDRELVVVTRQREGERKRKGTGKGGNARDKELETKMKEIREHRSQLDDFIKEFIDSVFVHRYRDLDPNIRAECVHALGLWFRKYPTHFLEATYLQYVGWVLSDSHVHVRLEAVRALSGVYDQADYIGSLNHFTERFKPRWLEMATSDTELSVRVAIIQVLGAIDGHSLLEEEEREKLCLLVFDEEAKVRKAVSQFVKGVWEEAVEERLVGRKKATDEDRKRAGVKALAMLLVKWGKALDHIIGETDESDNGDVEADNEDDIAEATSRPARRRKELIALATADHKGRMALAVEALWDEVEPVSDWEGLLDVLLLDHSASEEGDTTATPRARANSKKRVQDSQVDEAWRLEEVEESIVLEVLVTALKRAKADTTGAKKGEEDSSTNDITRALIKALPRLFIKHQTDQNRIAEVLVIPTVMNLDLYLEMRMITAYASLWDDVTKQFMSHSSVNVLTHAMIAVRYFMDATSLSNTNSTKILELEDELSSSLRDTVAGRDEIEVASFSEDEVLSLTAICTRLAVLAGTRNMTAWMEENEGGKQSSAWDIVNAVVERGRLGYKEEEAMIEQALRVLTLHILWKGKGLTAENDSSPEEIRYRDELKEQRESLLEKLVEYAVGTQSNTAEGVKRAAFKHLLDLHVLFAAAQTVSADGKLLPTATLSLTMDDEIQYRCAGYVQAEIERYADSLDEEVEEEDDEEEAAKDSDEDDSDEEQPEQAKNTKKARKRRNSPKEVDLTSRSRLEQEYLFIDVISTFLRAIRAGAIHIHHGAVLLAHYDRLGVAFDTCSKVVVDILREEGMLNNNGELVVAVLTQALREAYTLVLDGVVRDESNSLQLAKVLANCFVIRGSQLSVVRRLESQYIVQIHTTLLTWIGKRLATYQSNKNKKSLKSAVMFFRALVPLVSMIESRDALKIKAHMDQILAQAKAEVSPISKAWEPQRAYEKRLTTAMAKDKPTKIRKAGKGTKGVAAVTSDEDESEVERPADGSEVDAPASPKPRRRTRGQVPKPVEDSEQENVGGDEPEPVTPKARPRPRPAHKAKSLVKPRAEERPASPTGSMDAGASEPQPSTPKTSRKRPRDKEDEEQEEPVTTNGAVDHDDGSDLPATPAADIQVRRKRVRH